MLRSRLTLGLLPLLLLFLAVCLYAFRASQDLGGAVQGILDHNFQSIARVKEMRLALGQMNDALSQGVQAGAGRDGGGRGFDEGRARFKRSLNDELLASPAKDKAGLLNDLDDQFQRFTQAGETIFRGGPFDLVGGYGQAEAALIRVNTALESVLESDHEEIRAAERRIQARTEDTLRLLFAAMLVAVALFFFLAWRLASSLLEPIKALTDSAMALGQGELEREVPVTSRDEIGQLAKAFNTMAGHLRAYREATLAKVLRTQRTMEATLTSAPDPVFVISRDGTHTVRNPAAEQLVQAYGFDQGFPSALAEPLARVMATGDHYLPTDYGRAVPLRVAREDRHYLPRILAIGDKLTEFKGAAIILQDVTKFRLLDDAKTNLVGTVSHELKTPLTSLRMAIYLLLEQNVGALAPKQRELLETARDDADRLLRILDNLLDLTRLEGGASALDRRRVKIDGLLDQIFHEGCAFIDPAGQTLALDIEPGLGAETLNVDEQRIRHVFINLLSNASRYSPAGGTITLSASSGPLGFVRFSVKDSGTGIAAEDIPHVFDRFYRAPDQEKSGAGLGLTIAREIVVAHGGSITCTSEPGRGTEFYFLLPR
ncbi:MAG TPA: ATP-binding protein [Opitutaceae bacterium]|nr:ATP-binding protein [Opitutaceae bacterium]